MKYVCDVCGWEYDEENGYPEGGIAPGTKWKDIQTHLCRYPHSVSRVETV